MSDNNRNIIIEIIDIFILQVKEIAEEMKKKETIKDYDALSKLAHKAKSSVAIMGLKTLAQKLNELELLAKDNRNPESYADYIKLFIAESEAANKELMQYRNNPEKITPND